jgi:hypothetical protein
MTSWAYGFSCERSLYEMAPILNGCGPWTWGVRDCAFYPDYLQCRPHEDLRLCVYEVDPPGGPAYRCHVEIRSRTRRREAVEPVLLALLGELPARSLIELEAGAWPFD